MLLNTESGHHLINEITYPIIAEFYPHELPLYLTLRDTFFANPENFLHSRLVEDALLKPQCVKHSETDRQSGLGRISPPERATAAARW